MMGLAHGKVSECTARLALAQGMIQVRIKYNSGPACTLRSYDCACYYIALS